MSRARKYTCENDVKRHVKELLTAHGWTHWPNAAGPYSVAGLEDRSALKDGQFLAVESKFGDNKLTASQTKRLNDVRGAGGRTFIATEKNLGKFEENLDLFDKMRRIVERL